MFARSDSHDSLFFLNLILLQIWRFLCSQMDQEHLNCVVISKRRRSLESSSFRCPIVVNELININIIQCEITWKWSFFVALRIFISWSWREVSIFWSSSAVDWWPFKSSQMVCGCSQCFNNSRSHKSPLLVAQMSTKVCKNQTLTDDCPLNKTGHPLTPNCHPTELKTPDFEFTFRITANLWWLLTVATQKYLIIIFLHKLKKKNLLASSFSILHVGVQHIKKTNILCIILYTTAVFPQPGMCLIKHCECPLNKAPQSLFIQYAWEYNTFISAQCYQPTVHSVRFSYWFSFVHYLPGGATKMINVTWLGRSAVVAYEFR